VAPERPQSLESRTGTESCLACWGEQGLRARDSTPRRLGLSLHVEQLIRIPHIEHAFRLLLGFNCRAGTSVSLMSGLWVALAPEFMPLTLAAIRGISQCVERYVLLHLLPARFLTPFYTVQLENRKNMESRKRKM